MGYRHINEIHSDTGYSLKEHVKNIIPGFVSENMNQKVRTEKPMYAEVIEHKKRGREWNVAKIRAGRIKSWSPFGEIELWSPF